MGFSDIFNTKARRAKQKEQDAEVAEFRDLMQVPSTFEEGFNFKSYLGAIFIGLIMIPGAIYMELLAGGANIGPAAQWVTVILFIEAARRAQQSLSRSEIFILFFMAGISVNLPFQDIVLYQQFYIRSEAAISQGIAELLPFWYAPDPNTHPESYEQRTFLHWDWMPVIALAAFRIFLGQVNNIFTGYGLFRLTSDIEKLPFPLAPVGAQGILALAEEKQTKDDDLVARDEEKREQPWRWRVFSIGGAMGLFFGFIYLGIPTLSTLFTEKTIKLLPIPFAELTDKTDEFLPAVATGMSFDFTNIIIGMVLPYYAMLGSFIGLVVTMVLNPFLYQYEILSSWESGDKTVETLFKNNVDFYLSFQIGVSLAVALVGIMSVWKIMGKKKDKTEKNTEDIVKSTAPPPGRGDLKTWSIIGIYIFITSAYITVSGFLIDWHPGVMAVLVFLGFLYTPIISYVTARLEGVAGQVVEIPMIRQACLILSGYKGVDVWFLPIPFANFGVATVGYRTMELTGTKFTSKWKATLFVYPVILVCQIVFASFIWGLAEVPSSRYPFAEIFWKLEAYNQSIMYSATLGDYSTFDDAFSWTNVGVGTGAGLILFSVMKGFSAPVFLTYGVVRGLGQSMPHVILPQFLGAVIGRYYFQRKLGKKWRQYVPVLVAGFACGMGLITMATIGLTFLSKAAVQFPF